MSTMAPVLDSAIRAPRVASATVELITDVGRFLALEPEWNDAVERAGVAHPFLTHEWLRTWWECFGGGNRSLHIIVARRAGEVHAIAPLMCERTHMYGVPVRKLDFIQNDHTPRADVVVAGPAADGWHVLWHALQDIRRGWDVLQFSRLARDSKSRAMLERLAAGARCPTGVWQGDVSPYLATSGTWDAYAASLSARFRSNLRNRLSRLTKIGEPRLEALAGGDAIEAARRDAVRLEASGWKAQAGTSIQSDPAVERFYTTLATRASARGWLRLLFLKAGDRRVATAYGARYRNRLFLFKTGYDPEYAACAPFKLLTYFALEAAHREGLSEVDFLGDAEPWKLEWTQTSRAHDWFYVFGPGRRARLLHWLKFQTREPRQAAVARWSAMAPELKKWRA